MMDSTKRRSVFLLVIALNLSLRVSNAIGRAETLSILHPDDPTKKVEYFLQKPPGSGPWPTVIFLHGHQQLLRPGGKDFVDWGVLDRFAERGYLAVAVSQPGYGNSTGPADFCGPFTQRAVEGVIERLRVDGYLNPNRILIEGISRGALVAGLLAEHNPSIAGVVLISGLYDLPQFVAEAKSDEAKKVASSIIEETGGANSALRERSVLSFAKNLKPAALIINGAKDDRTDPGQAQRSAAEIVANGGKARSIIYPDYGHQIPINVRDREIDPFIQTVLGK